MPTRPDSNPLRNFETFFNNWLIRHQNFSDQLLLALTPENIHKTHHHQSLIDQLLLHYQHYYQEKSRAARDDVCVVLSPPWFTSFERTFFWIGGFKPLLIFKLINGSVDDSTELQKHEVDRLATETRKEERELSHTMARIQESVASPQLLNLMRHATHLIDGEVSALDSAMNELQMAKLMALEAADALRGKVVRKVVEILNPVQTVKLFAAAAQLHLRIRSRGLFLDQHRIPI